MEKPLKSKGCFQELYCQFSPECRVHAGGGDGEEQQEGAELGGAQQTAGRAGPGPGQQPEDLRLDRGLCGTGDETFRDGVDTGKRGNLFAVAGQPGRAADVLQRVRQSSDDLRLSVGRQ